MGAHYEHALIFKKRKKKKKGIQNYIHLENPYNRGIEDDIAVLQIASRLCSLPLCIHHYALDMKGKRKMGNEMTPLLTKIRLKEA